MFYLKKFNTIDEYEDFKRSADYIEPNICGIEEGNLVFLTPYEPDHLAFEALEPCTFSFTQNTIQYSMDGTTWNDLTVGASTPTVNAGSKIYFKATNPSIAVSDGIGTFSSTGKFNVSGNIMSLLFGDDFDDKTDLTGKDYVFSNLFKNCKLIDAKNLILPATTLSNRCYYYMFYGCTSLVTAPVLPATNLVYCCYEYMFRDCASLVNAPELPATTLAKECYYGIFRDCTSLTTAPELPATTLVEGCYSYMFYGCSSLTVVPELPVTTLTDYCYEGIFCFCSSLVNAPELPATTLAKECYDWMFEGCTSLTVAPELPATTLMDGCYRNMFKDCTSLTTAPELPATTLVTRCYQYMFQGCSNLNNITMLATDVSASDCLDNWVDGVAPTGTFVKHPHMDLLPTGTSGIPSGWTVVHVDGSGS